MKKNSVFVVVAAVVGLLLGYLIFGSNASDEGSADGHNHSEEMASGQMWTCSMHPQIMQPEPGDCPICGMDLIPASSSDEGLAMGQIRMSNNAMALAGVETVTVGAGITGEGSVKLSGKVAINQEADAVQSAYFNGRIERLNINFEGEEVRKGQQLATIYSPELVAAQQELITAANLKGSQPALYAAVRNKLTFWKLSENQINEIESSGKVRENFPVYANVSGVVSEIMVEEGDYVSTGSPLVKVANLNSVWAVFDAYENQLSLLKKGQNLEVRTKSYPNETFNAKISFVDPLLNSSTRTLEVRANLDNRKGLLKPGMFVSAEIHLENNTETEALTVPESAVLWTGERSVVYIKPNSEEGIFEMREVTLGNLINGDYVIVSGLSSGEEVVAKGAFTVDAAAQLQGKKSMMNQEGKTMGMKQDHHSSMGGDMKMEFSEEAQNTFGDLLQIYLELKDALVASDPDQTQKLAQKGAGMASTISGLPMDGMGKSHMSQLAIQFKDMASKSDLEGQRDVFVLLSQNMIQVGQQMQGLNVKLYVQQCPMANQNNGANWLSLDKEVKNPYYGEAMLKCGSVVSVIN